MYANILWRVKAERTGIRMDYISCVESAKKGGFPKKGVRNFARQAAYPAR